MQFTAVPMLVLNEVPLKSLAFSPWAKHHSAADSWLSCRSASSTASVNASDPNRHESQESAAGCCFAQGGNSSDFNGTSFETSTGPAVKRARITRRAILTNKIKGKCSLLLVVL